MSPVFSTVSTVDGGGMPVDDDLKGSCTCFQLFLQPCKLTFTQHRLRVGRLIRIAVVTVVEHEKFYIRYLEGEKDAINGFSSGSRIWPVFLKKVQCQVTPFKGTVGIVGPVIMIIPDGIDGDCRENRP